MFSSDMTTVQTVYNRIDEDDCDDDEYGDGNMHDYQEMRPPVPPRLKRPLS